MNYSTVETMLAGYVSEYKEALMMSYFGKGNITAFTSNTFVVSQNSITVIHVKDGYINLIVPDTWSVRTNYNKLSAITSCIIQPVRLTYVGNGGTRDYIAYRIYTTDTDTDI